LRAFLMRLQVADVGEAAALVDALTEAFGQEDLVSLEREERVVSLAWAPGEADEPDEWDEQAFAVLVFFLRAWSRDDPKRDLIVLEERPVDVPADALRRAS
jgi:hypothetical protein